MSSFGWQGRLEAASSEAEVVEVVRDYIAKLTPTDIERLPPPCRPGEMKNGRDVTAFAFIIVRHHCADDIATARLVNRIASFFSDATVRLSQLSDSNGKADKKPG